MTNDKKKNKKNAGRKRKFNTSELLMIIDKYKDSGLMRGKVSFSELAKFANENLKLKDKIRYDHFSNDKEVKELIDKWNDTSIGFKGYFSESGKEYSISNIEPKAFIMSDIQNPHKLILKLENYKRSYDILIKEYLAKDTKCQELNKEVNELNEEIKTIKNKLKKEKNINLTLKEYRKNTKTFVEDYGNIELIEALKTTELVLLAESEEIEEIKIEKPINIKKLTPENGGSIDDIIEEFSELW